MAVFKELVDWDNFFYYGLYSSNFKNEIEGDLIAGLLQPKSTMFYNRTFGSGVAEKENYPSGISLMIGLRYEIAMHIARENQKVSNGIDGTKDRRISVSQTSIAIKEPNPKNQGNIDVSITYIPLETQIPGELSLPIGI